METPVMQAPPPPATKTNSLSVVSLITGIVGFISMCLGVIPFLGWVCYGISGLAAIAALITGFIGINKMKASGEKGRGMAITGIVFGALGLLGVCVMIIISVALGPVIGNVFSSISNNLIAP
jgi:hypothetical protein